MLIELIIPTTRSRVVNFLFFFLLTASQITECKLFIMSSKGRAQVQRGGDTPKFALEDIEVPRPGDYEVLVKNSYVAQNPTDGTP